MPKLRKYISETCSVFNIIDFGELPVFQAATFPMIFIAQKGRSFSQLPFFTQVKSLKPPYPDVLVIIHEQGYALSSAALNGTEWVLTDTKSRERLQIMEKAGIPLHEFGDCQMFNGVKTGLNEAFVIDKATKLLLTEQDKTSENLIFPFLEGDDVRKYFVKKQEASLIYVRWTDHYKSDHPIMRHLAKFRSKLVKRDGVKENGPCPWYALSRPRPESFPLFLRPKIIYPLIALEPRFTVNETGAIPNNSVYCIVVDNILFVLGVLNSSAAWEYLKQKCAVLGDQDNRGRLQLTTSVLENFPIPRASAADQSSASTLAKKCLDAKGVGCEELEQEIDERVAALYGL